MPSGMSPPSTNLIDDGDQSEEQRRDAHHPDADHLAEQQRARRDDREQHLADAVRLLDRDAVRDRDRERQQQDVEQRRRDLPTRPGGRPRPRRGGEPRGGNVEHRTRFVSREACRLAGTPAPGCSPGLVPRTPTRTACSPALTMIAGGASPMTAMSASPPSTCRASRLAIRQGGRSAAGRRRSDRACRSASWKPPCGDHRDGVGVTPPADDRREDHRRHPADEQHGVDDPERLVPERLPDLSRSR